MKIIADGYKSLVTQVFDSSSDYIKDDSAFAVKNDLKVEFIAREGDPKAKMQLEYNMSLGRKKN